MKYGAWAAAVLGLSLVWSPALSAQVGDREAPIAEVGRNYPNPFNPETWIPFRLDVGLWESEAPRVSLRIYNVLAQLVAIPVLDPSGERLDDLELDWNGTGGFLAFWDGKVLNTGREAASGVYLYQLVVNGRTRGSRRMTVIK